MYTEIKFNAELKKETPGFVIELLKYMVGETEDVPSDLPKHELFKTDRWAIMLRCDSFMFPGKTHSIVFYNAIANAYFINVQSNFKNYGNEIEKFCDWINEYVLADDGEYLGHKFYEESEQPTSIVK